MRRTGDPYCRHGILSNSREHGYVDRGFGDMAKINDRWRNYRVCLVLALGAWLWGCAEDGVAPADTTQPSAVEDLTAATVTATSVELAWTAPGDDGREGRAAAYDIRYSTLNLREPGVWDQAQEVDGQPVPGEAGSPESTTVDGLAHETRYFIVIKTVDDAGNWSRLSNLVDLTTLPDTTPPAGITDLAIGPYSVWGVQVTWTAPGDDGNEGTVASYELRFHHELIDESNWAAATHATGNPPAWPAGSTQSHIFTELGSSILYFFAVKTVDEAGNWSAVSNSPSATTGP